MEWGQIFPGCCPKLNAAVCRFLSVNNFLHKRCRNEPFQIGIVGCKYLINNVFFLWQMPIFHIYLPFQKAYLKNYWKGTINNLFKLFASSPTSVKWFCVAHYVLKSIFKKRVPRGTRGRHGYSQKGKSLLLNPDWVEDVRANKPLHRYKSEKANIAYTETPLPWALRKDTENWSDSVRIFQDNRQPKKKGC